MGLVLHHSAKQHYFIPIIADCSDTCDKNLTEKEEKELKLKLTKRISKVLAVSLSQATTIVGTGCWTRCQNLPVKHYKAIRRTLPAFWKSAETLVLLQTHFNRYFSQICRLNSITFLIAHRK